MFSKSSSKTRRPRLRGLVTRQSRVRSLRRGQAVVGFENNHQGLLSGHRVGVVKASRRHSHQSRLYAVCRRAPGQAWIDRARVLMHFTISRDGAWIPKKAVCT